MAFKMKGSPMQRNFGIGGSGMGQKHKSDLELDHLTPNSKPETEKSEGTKKVDFASAALNEVGGFPEYEGKEIPKASKKDMSALKQTQGTGGSGIGQKHMADIETSKQKPMRGLTWMKDGKKQFVTKEQFLSDWDKHMAELREGGADQATISKAMSWKKASEQRLK